MAKKQAEAGASAPDVELSVMTVEVLHPSPTLTPNMGAVCTDCRLMWRNFF